MGFSSHREVVSQALPPLPIALYYLNYILVLRKSEGVSVPIRNREQADTSLRFCEDKYTTIALPERKGVFHGIENRIKAIWRFIKIF